MVRLPLRHSLRFGPVLALALLATGCIHRAPSHVGDEEEGLASYYGDEFEGRSTASGEPFHNEALTCAHRTLPFGTWVEVTAEHSGRTVRVRVNDRGPYVSGRIVDLSQRAARQIGLLHAGQLKVRLRVVRLPHR